MTTTLVVHGHFYQPPREDPTTGTVLPEPSAAPWHDWNSRITAECYHPNTAAKVVDSENRVRALVDNFRLLSFNVGPTLLSWLDDASPETYARIVAAGRATRGAIAQGFNHVILPLCNERDRRTQVRWGLADFRFRFGYDAAGMWLPETAVDDATLQVLAEEGVSFTILAPRQAVSIGGRPVDEATLDPSTPYRWEGQRGASVTVLFYDGGLSNDVAFGIGAMTSEVLIDRVVNRNKPLVVIATDGETFGHHHHFADRTLAYALTAAASQRGVRVATAAEIVGEMPASETVAVRPSAWSCAHGVERWRSDCGCSTGGGPGWHQRWRAPLRAALDLFRDAAAAVFERRGAALFAGGDPWAVRDRYVEVVIGEREWSDFESEHVTQEHAVARTLLEAQRSAMAMYTSCGWFFNDIAGIEAQIVLRHASSLADRLATIDEALPIEQFVSILATAIGNQRLNGADVWAEIRTAGRAARRIPAGQSAHMAHMAPIVSSFDSAQERVLSALQRRAALDDDDLGVIATALAISPDVMEPDVMEPDVMEPDQQ